MWSVVTLTFSLTLTLTQLEVRDARMQMGVQNTCDDAVSNLDNDWPNFDPYEYTCQPSEETFISTQETPTKEYCIPKKKVPYNAHKCMREEIKYDEHPPIGGPHRPNWAVYGEYQYLPPQRWLHNVEHGAAVFLYHPCADPFQVRQFREIAHSCLWKHVTSPSRDLQTPFAVVTYGCRLTLMQFDKEAITTFVKAHAKKATEGSIKDGKYKLRLIRPAEIVSDKNDSEICPEKPAKNEAENEVNGIIEDLLLGRPKH